MDLHLVSGEEAPLWFKGDAETETETDTDSEHDADPPPPAAAQRSVEAEGHAVHAENGGGSPPTTLTLGQRMQVHRNMKLLYLSHFFSAWGDRMWEFAIALFLIGIYENTLLLAALYGFAKSLGSVVFGPLVGRYVDTQPRLKVVQRSLGIQNLAVGVCVSCILILYTHPEAGGAGLHVAVTLLILSAIVGTLANTATNLSVEKDWVRTIIGSDKMALATTNAILRRIDLSCKILGPLSIGLVMTYGGVLAGAATIVCWNFFFWLPEFYLLAVVYRSFPSLHGERKVVEEKTTSISQLALSSVNRLRLGWGVYYAQETFRPGMALALLYCTVLSFEAIMTAYVYWRGMSEALLGGIRGVGAIFGLLSTWIYPRLVERFSIEKTGLCSIWLQLACLVLSVASLAVPYSNAGNCNDLLETSAYEPCISARNTELGLLLGGVVSSRLGLWMFDLTVTQLLQTRTQLENEAGEAVFATINGVQRSLSELFTLFSMVLGIGFHKTSDFPVLVLVSFGAVFVAGVLYASYYFRVDVCGRISGRPGKRRPAEQEDVAMLIF